MNRSKDETVNLLLVSEERLMAIVEKAVRKAIIANDKDEVLTLCEAAAFLRISTKTLSRRVSAGQIETMPGAQTRFLRSALVLGKAGGK